MSKDDRKFQLDILKIQLRYQEISTSYHVVLTTTISIFVALGLTFLSYGLSSDTDLYSLMGAIIILALIPINSLISRKMLSDKFKEMAKKNEK